MPLKLVAATGSPSLLVREGRAFTVGRAATCDLPIQDPTVSRRHAELELAGAGVRVRDMGSTNGTYLDGTRITDALVTSGSHIAFGKVDFEVVAELPAAVEETAEAFDGEGSLDATILRQVPVASRPDIASQLAETADGPSLLRIPGSSREERQTRKLNLLLDIAKELSRQADVDRLFDKIVGLTFQVMNVERVAVMTVDAGELVPRVWRSRVASPAGSWKVPRRIARKALEEGVAVLSENVPAEVAGTSDIQSALCAPLLGSEGTALGIIYLDSLGAGHSFSEEDLQYFTAFAGMAAVAIENGQLIERMRREAVKLSNFQRYFTPDLALQIAGQEGEIQLGGAKRQVVVLFSDIRGFTSLSERMSPDEIAGLLTDYFTEMVEIVFEHGGTLDKFMGDALMALWGRRSPARTTPTRRPRRRSPCSARSPRSTSAGPAGAAGPLDRHRHQCRRGLRREHRQRAPARVHGDRRRGEHRLAPLLGGRPRRDPDRRAAVHRPAPAAPGVGAHPLAAARQGAARAGLPGRMARAPRRPRPHPPAPRHQDLKRRNRPMAGELLGTSPPPPSRTP